MRQVEMQNTHPQNEPLSKWLETNILDMSIWDTNISNLYYSLN